MDDEIPSSMPHVITAVLEGNHVQDRVYRIAFTLQYISSLIDRAVVRCPSLQDLIMTTDFMSNVSMSSARSLRASVMAWRDIWQNDHNEMHACCMTSANSACRQSEPATKSSRGRLYLEMTAKASESCDRTRGGVDNIRPVRCCLICSCAQYAGDQRFSMLPSQVNHPQDRQTIEGSTTWGAKNRRLQIFQ